VADSRQQSLDIVNGPLFTVDLFSIDGEDQAVLLTAHHLIVDLVSWRIIWHDIEQHLQVEQLPSHSSLSFQSWSELQAQASYSLQLSDVLPFPAVPPTNFSFWGIQCSENDFRDCQVYSSLLSEVDTTLLLGDSNECFRTEPVDLILGALIHSFGQVFPDRQVPPIFLEGHGREPVDDIDADLSETVGWFTTLHPVQIPNSHGSLSDTVKFTKDIRRQIPGKGRPYFAYRYHSKEALEKHQTHQAVEIILNYTGKYQQLENPNALFKPEDRAEIAHSVDISPAAQRFALIDVSADVDQGRLSITFQFKHQMKHQARLQKWLQIFEQTLKQLVHSLTEKAMEFTLSDFPLLRISYQGLEVLFTNRLPALGVSVEYVQDIYPCTAVQEGILLSTRKGAASYANYWVWNCVSSTEDKPSPVRLEEAWRTVARKHAILSTILVEHPDTGSFIQVVLGGLRHRVNHLSTAAKNPADVLFEQPGESYLPGEPLHTFTICQGADNSVACRLDINHVLMDAASMQILLDDLTRSYHGYQLEEAPSFRDLVQSLGTVAKAERLQYWTRFLDGVSPCKFSSITPLEQTSHSHNVVNLPLESMAGIESFCKSHGITRSVFLQVAWALVLWHYTGMREICFGYMASGRDAPIANIDKMIGPLINILISRIDLRLPLNEALAATSEQSIEHLDYQHASLAEIQHELGIGSRQLFNTAITVREGTSSKNRSLGAVEFQEVHSDDPHEVRLQAAY
jgi:non-ribosomal peptide synthase protein (TIGR01720 family)